MDQREIDWIKYGQNPYEKVEDQELKCVMCGKTHKRKDTHLWVYHISKGVLCRNHHGVMEWYNDLLEKAGKDV
jgi:hypothetical protein